MNLLIDTNIVIPMEPGSYIDTGINTVAALEFHKLASRSGSVLFIHEAIHDDINRDRNQDRAHIRRLLLKRYSILRNSGIAPQYIDIIGNPPTGSNDWVDNQLLIALKSDIVDYLVSEDLEIHRKARRLDLKDRVLFLNDAINLLRDLFDISPPPLPKIKFVYVYNLDNTDPIFQSLREDYNGFDQWLTKCKREQRQAFVIHESGQIAGLAILKREPQLPNGLISKTLKLCTLKVSDNYSGQRYGELLLKSVFTYGMMNQYDYTYFTVLPKYEKLIDFAQDFGFCETANPQATTEKAFAKKFKPSDEEKSSLPALELHRLFGPRLTSFTGNSSFLVPIRPVFHRALFPEIENQQMLLNLPCGNSIKKAYLSHSNNTSIEEGDNIFFYRSQDVQGITGLGIVDGVRRSEQPNEIARYVGTRTVYSYSQIEAMSDKPVLAIKFRLVDLFDSPILLKDMIADDIVNGPPQSITSLNDERIRWLRERIAI